MTLFFSKYNKNNKTRTWYSEYDVFWEFHFLRNFYSSNHEL
jgi:hypothetical protein